MKQDCTEILDADQAAELLRVSKTTLYALAKKSKLPGRRVGREWRFVKMNLLDWIGDTKGNGKPCWEIKNCPEDERNSCAVFLDNQNRLARFSAA